MFSLSLNIKCLRTLTFRWFSVIYNNFNHCNSY